MSGRGCRGGGPRAREGAPQKRGWRAQRSQRLRPQTTYARPTPTSRPNTHKTRAVALARTCLTLSSSVTTLSTLSTRLSSSEKLKLERTLPRGTMSLRPHGAIGVCSSHERFRGAQPLPTMHADPTCINTHKQTHTHAHRHINLTVSFTIILTHACSTQRARSHEVVLGVGPLPRAHGGRQPLLVLVAPHAVLKACGQHRLVARQRVCQPHARGELERRAGAWREKRVGCSLSCCPLVCFGARLAAERRRARRRAGARQQAWRASAGMRPLSLTTEKCMQPCGSQTRAHAAHACGTHTSQGAHPWPCTPGWWR